MVWRCCHQHFGVTTRTFRSRIGIQRLWDTPTVNMLLKFSCVEVVKKLIKNSLSSSVVWWNRYLLNNSTRILLLAHNSGNVSPIVFVGCLSEVSVMQQGYLCFEIMTTTVTSQSWNARHGCLDFNSISPCNALCTSLNHEVKSWMLQHQVGLSKNDKIQVKDTLVNA